MTLTADQIRQACAILRWGSPKLADRSGVAYEAVASAWSHDSVKAMSEVDIQKARSALEAAGVEFIPENGGSAGVRLRKAET